MPWRETLFPDYGAGEIYRNDSLVDRKGSRAARRFLDRLFKGFAKHCAEYYRHTNDQLFTYGERQVHTAFLSSILDITKVAQAELQVKRRPKGEKKSSGRVNYWLRAWKSVFFIELKQTVHAARSKKLSSYAQSQWEELVSQVKSLRVDQVRDETLSLAGDNLFVIGLFVVPTYVFRTQRDGVSQYLNRASREIIQSNCIVGESIGFPKPNWHGCWIIPKNMRMTEYSNGYDIWDGVNCFAYVRQVLRKQSK